MALYAGLTNPTLSNAVKQGQAANRNIYGPPVQQADSKNYMMLSAASKPNIATPPKTTVPNQQNPTTDPNAAALRQAQADASAKEAQRIAGIIQQLQVGQEGVQSGGSTQLRDIINSYYNNNRNTVQQIQAGQDAINSTRENTALNLRRGMSGIVNSVRQGVKSGGVQLANMNASDSGAAEALARAYAELGNKQTISVRDQAATENRGTDVQQKALTLQEQNALADFNQYRTTETDRISNDLYNQLRVLDANASAQGVSGRVDFSVRDKLINDAIAKLNDIDKSTQSSLAGTVAETPDQIAAAAARLDAAGAQGGNPFSVAPASNAVSTSPAYSSTGGLPIYYRKPDQAA